MKKPELLAPAGNRECMRAAVGNGADAVYFGLRRFSARQRAENFAAEELEEVVGGLHERNVRAYVAVNTLVFSGELAGAAACVEAAARAGADAIIVQDLGLARLAHEMAPTLPIHASTQMTLSEAWGINEVARRLGVRRVILPRELSLAEIAAVAAATDVELEVFLHGALCISYSGQCLASLFQGGRSGNRGQCAQPCRLPYEVVVDGETGACPPKRAGRWYPLSPRDLSGWRAVGELARIGVRGLKIEGRLKDACYVAASVRLYRGIIDRGPDTRDRIPGTATRSDLMAVEQMFARGAREGWLGGADHRALVEGRTPASTGVRVGTVERVTRRGLMVRMQSGAEIAPGDGVVFREHCQLPIADCRLSEGRDCRLPEEGGSSSEGELLSSNRGELGGRVWEVRGAGPKAIELTFAGGLDLAKVARGAEVWKTDDPQLRKRLEATFARVAPVRRDRMDVIVHAAAGAPPRAQVADALGRRAEATGDELLETAIKHPLTAELVREHFERLGGAPLALDAVTLIGADGAPADELPVMAPKRVLNELRRRAVEGLMRARREASRHAVRHCRLPIAERPIGADCRLAEGGAASGGQASSLSLAVLARSLGQVKAAVEGEQSVAIANLQSALRNPQLVYADVSDAGERREAMAVCRGAGIAVGLATSRVLLPGREDDVRRLVDHRPDVVLVRNLGAAAILRAEAPQLRLVADFSLNAANELTAGVLVEVGFERVTLSWDLDGRQMEAMLRRMDPSEAEVIVSGRGPMFFTRHCLFAAEAAARDAVLGLEAPGATRPGSVRFARGSGEKRGGCGRGCREHRMALRDRKGELLPVAADETCANTVYSPRARAGALGVDELAALGIRHFRVELLLDGDGGTLAGLVH